MSSTIQVTIGFSRTWNVTSEPDTAVQETGVPSVTAKPVTYAAGTQATCGSASTSQPGARSLCQRTVGFASTAHLAGSFPPGQMTVGSALTPQPGVTLGSGPPPSSPNPSSKPPSWEPPNCGGGAPLPVPCQKSVGSALTCQPGPVPGAGAPNSPKPNSKLPSCGTLCPFGPAQNRHPNWPCTIQGVEVHAPLADVGEER